MILAGLSKFCKIKFEILNLNFDSLGRALLLLSKRFKFSILVAIR